MWLWYDKQDEQRIDKNNPGMIGSGQALISSAMHPGFRHTRDPAGTNPDVLFLAVGQS